MGLLDDLPFAVWAIMVPMAAAPLVFLLDQGGARRIGLLVLPINVLTVTGLAWQVWSLGPRRYAIGGWGAPLGIDFYADGLSALLLLMTAGVGVLISLYANAYFADPHGSTTEHTSGRNLFWPLWLFLWGALNSLFLSADIFNLYVTLELISLSAVALVALADKPDALIAAMRYMLIALWGSMAYLFGVALIYATYGTLDLTELGQSMESGVIPAFALSLMTVGLLMKSALFPLHFWLPPAHANAPAPVSAMLSALVVKAAFYLLLRLWFQVFLAVISPHVGLILGTLGAVAILWGSVQALLAERVKLVVAYSTVAQLGYIFLLFRLATPGADGQSAWSGGVYLAVAHAYAKAAMFLAAGNLMHAVGHDRISGLAGIAPRLPLTFFTIGLAGVSLIGLPPTGGFVAKWMLLEAAMNDGHWWIVLTMMVGGLMTAGYWFRILGLALTNPTSEDGPLRVPRVMEYSALVLALIALALGLLASPALALLQIGSPWITGDDLERQP